MLEIGEGIILDNKEYIVIDIIDYNNKIYLVLSNTNDSSDIAFRILDNNLIKGLSSDDELISILKVFKEKQGL